MSVFSYMKVRCTICGCEIDGMHAYGRDSHTCGKECHEEWEWRRTLAIMGKPYRMKDKVYSGDASWPFWNRINAFQSRSPKVWERLYGMGCELQNLEHFMLEELCSAEKQIKKPAKKRKRQEPRP